MTPVPVLGWDADRDTWLAARLVGIGASDVGAVLGFSSYRSPWQVWAEKTGFHRPDDTTSEAAQLGTDLEPYLLAVAERVIGLPVRRTAHQLYRSGSVEWALCSPDAHIVHHDRPEGRVGVQLKTAGLVSGFGPPKGWQDGGCPLGYELQCRWEMFVMGWVSVELVALVANMGVLRRTLVRDAALEAELLGQVRDWYCRHVVAGTEPPLGQADNEILAALFPTASGHNVDLDGTDALQHWFGYRQARDQEKKARADKLAHSAMLKKSLGDASAGHIDNRLIVTWSTRKGELDIKRLCAENDIDPERYRKPDTRTLTVKDP